MCYVDLISICKRRSSCGRNSYFQNYRMKDIALKSQWMKPEVGSIGQPVLSTAQGLLITMPVIFHSKLLLLGVLGWASQFTWHQIIKGRDKNLLSSLAWAESEPLISMQPSPPRRLTWWHTVALAPFPTSSCELGFALALLLNGT